jgi:hypothetical protein
MALVSLTPHLTPHGRLLLVRDDDASLLEAKLAHRIQNAFGRGAGHGLLHLGATELVELDMQKMRVHIVLSRDAIRERLR